MADDKYTFEQARVRLEEIVAQVRRKDVSLEASIDLLEEGVRLANMCTELSDHTEWRAIVEEQDSTDPAEGDHDAGEIEPSDEPAGDISDDAEATSEGQDTAPDLSSTE
jgi:exodeoxyribonuclease VII small subunit